MEHFSSLDCSGAVDITVSSLPGGVKICSANPILCEIDGTRIRVRGRPSLNMGGIVINDGAVIISGWNNNNCNSMEINCGRIIIDGVDVSTRVRQTEEERKGTSDQELDDEKREHTLLGTISFDKISLSGSSQCVVQDYALLSTSEVRLRSSGSSNISLPSCKIDSLNIRASGTSNISGSVTTSRLVVDTSGCAKVSNFHATESATMYASGCSQTDIRINQDTKLNRNKSGCAKIIVSI